MMDKIAEIKQILFEGYLTDIAAEKINQLYEPQPDQPIVCLGCDGTGWKPEESGRPHGDIPCPNCKGTGKKSDHPSFEERWLENEAAAKKGDKPQPSRSRLLAPDKILGIKSDVKASDFQSLKELAEGIDQALLSAQRDLTASIKDTHYRQAVKDDRDGKPLDLTEEEFEIYHAIKNLAKVQEEHNGHQ